MYNTFLFFLLALSTSPSAEQLPLHSDNSTALPAYSTPAQDTEDDVIDTVWDELCTSLEGEMYGQSKDDLVNEPDSAFEQLVEQVGYTIQDRKASCRERV